MYRIEARAPAGRSLGTRTSKNGCGDGEARAVYHFGEDNHLDAEQP